MKPLALLVIVVAQTATRPNVIEAQIPGRAVDGAAVEFRRIAQSRNVLPDEVRVHWLQAVFDTATAGYRRDQPMDTVIDAAGEAAIYRRLRPEWDQGDVARWESALAALQSIDRTSLSDDDGLNHDIMMNVVRRNLALAAPPYLYMPLTNERGPHHSVWFYGSEWLPSQTLVDYRMVLAHLNGIALEIDGMIEGMRQAHAQGIRPPQSLVTNVRDDLAGVIVDDPMASGYLVKFTEFPASIPSSEQAVLRADAVRIYATKIKPAYERLLTYATDVHVPGAIPDTSFAALPGRAERYALILRLRTAPQGLSPAQVHQKALDDVARSTAAIDSMRAATGFQGSYSEFLEFLRSDSRFAFADSAAFLGAARALAERIDANISKMFYTVPRLPFVIEGAPGAGRASYQRAPMGDSTPGTVRLFISGERPGRTWLLPAMMLHEAVPGHHFSHAVFLERGIPPFRGLGTNSSFTEGWALYGESMGTELGVYDDEYARVGALVGDLWRGIRAVLETGIHALGWTHQEAMEYARRNSAHDDAQIAGELNGMWTRPGFASSYKIGQWKFQELRSYAEHELGAAFDVRAFHDALLDNGEVPLEVLDARMRDWVARMRPRE